MSVSVLRDNLSSGMRLASHAVKSRSTLPILGTVRLTAAADSGWLQIAATDLELSIAVQVGAHIAAPLDVAAPAEMLNDLLGKLADDKVLIEPGKDAIRLVSGSAKLNVKTLPVADFPAIDPNPVASDDGLTVSAAQLKIALAAALTSAAQDESRPAFTGVLFEFKPGGLVLAATDGFRLATSAIVMNTPEAWAGRRAVVPAKSLAKLIKCLGDADTVTIGLSGDNKRIQFALPNVSIAAQLIEANYPDYKQIVPRSHATRAVLETPALLRAIEMAHQVHQQGQISVTPGAPGQVAIASENPETGDCHVTLDATAEGVPLTILSRVDYLVDALKAITGVGAPNLAIELVSDLSPMMLKPVGAPPDRPGAAFLIMPLQPRHGRPASPNGAKAESAGPASPPEGEPVAA